MRKTKHHFGIALLQILIFVLILLTHYTSGLSLSIKGITPLPMLPLLTAFCMFHDESQSTFAGLFTGILMDSVAAGAASFNAVLLAVIALCTSLVVRYFFNNNIRSALTLSFTGSLVYFIVKWVMFFAFKETVQGNFIYLLKFALPAVLYTNIFIFPFYYLQKALYNRRTL